MRDLDIRCALHQDLCQQHYGQPDTLILDEVGLCQGVARVDVVVINGAINGYEIKSERDTLERLPAQQAVYSRTLDTVTIVASGPHVPEIMEMVPGWWGVLEAVEMQGEVRLMPVRPTMQNPHPDPMALVQLLWREETLEALRLLGLDKGLTSKPRTVLWERLATSTTIDELRNLVRCQLKARIGWRSVGSPG